MTQKNQKPFGPIKWCLWEGCDFHTSKSEPSLEDHVVEAHGVNPGTPKVKRPKVDPIPMFDRDQYLKQPERKE